MLIELLQKNKLKILPFSLLPSLIVSIKKKKISSFQYCLLVVVHGDFITSLMALELLINITTKLKKVLKENKRIQLIRKKHIAHKRQYVYA